MTGVRVGEAANFGPERESRRRCLVCSSDDSDFTPLVSPPVVSLSVLDVFDTALRSQRKC